MLVPDVFRGRGVDGVFRHVRGMIADAFETAGNEDQIQVAAELAWVFRHALDQTAARGAVHLVEPLIPGNDRARELHVFAHVSVKGVLEHRHRVRIHRLD